MKPTHKWPGLVLLLISLLFTLLTASPLAAQEEDIDDNGFQPDALEAEVGDILLFSRLGISLQTLSNNQKSYNLGFHIPAHWQIADGAEAVLDITSILHDNNIPTAQLAGASLEIAFNDTLLDSIPISQNSTQTLTIPIPSDRFSNGRNVLSINLRTNFGCGSTQDIVVGVQPTSFLRLPHQFVEPSLNLESFPYPLQQNAFLPDQAIIVTPDEPTTNDMEAILTTAAGMGRVTQRITIQLAAYSNLTPEEQIENHLIYVGQADHFPELSELSFPDVEADERDGVLKMAASPWNPAKVIMYVGGSSETAVTKAAQAIGFGIIRAGTDKQTAVINDVYFEETARTQIRATQTLEDLGYGLTTLNGPEMASATFRFDIPPVFEISDTETASINLLYNHSALLNFDLSGVNVLLNNQPVSSLRVEPDSIEMTQQIIELPGMLFQPGENTIRLVTELEPTDPCSGFREEGSWFNIYPESTLSLPLVRTSQDAPSARTIRQYPQPMAYDDQLSTTAFVLPAEDVNAWFAALQLAYQLGGVVTGDLLDIEVAFADDVPNTLREENSLLVIGKPSDLPFISEFESELPVPLSLENNRFEHDRLAIAYEIPDDVPLGYLTVSRSPWHFDRVVLTVLGDSDEGLQNATASLLTSRRNLNGDFAVVDGGQLFVTMSPQPIVEDSESAGLEEESGDPEGEESGTETAVSTQPDESTKVENNESSEPASASDATDAKPADTTPSAAESSEPASATTDAKPADTAPSPAESEPAPTPAPSQPTATQSGAARNIPTLPLAVLAVCLAALGVVGFRFYQQRQKS